MPKAIEKVPETVAELKTALPELCAQIEQDAVAAVDTKGIAAQAADAERTKIFGILAVELGDETAAKVSALVATGVTVEQLKAVKALQPASPPPASPSAEDLKKSQLLAAITGAGAPNVGHAGQAGSTGTDKDYMTLVDEHMAAYKCSKSEALQAITRKYPEKHRAYIKNANEGRA